MSAPLTSRTPAAIVIGATFDPVDARLVGDAAGDGAGLDPPPPDPAVTVRVTSAVAVADPFVAVMVKSVRASGLVAVPEITPVAALNDNPAGSPGEME